MDDDARSKRWQSDSKYQEYEEGEDLPALKAA